MELERPSSRLEEQKREEAIKELEEVKKARHLAMEALDMNVKEELLKVIIHNRRQYLRPPF